MAENSKIEWCDHTFNPWVGCAKVSPGCDGCYAEAWAKRAGQAAGVEWGGPRRRTSEANWRLPLKWNKLSEQWVRNGGHRARVFCASLADVFDKEVPQVWRQHLMSLVADTPSLDWLFLTKRIGNARRMLSDASMHDGRLLTADDQYRPPSNLWIGATVVNQAEADRDIPKLLEVPAAVRFLSIEPMLGPVDLQKPCTRRCPNRDCFPHDAGRRVVVDSENGGTLAECICSRLNGLSWVICGGESGPGARPMHPDWARSLRDQCAAAGVPFLFKQWGEWLGPLQHSSPAGQPKHINAGDVPVRIGKRFAGRQLDGVEHNGFPR